MPLLLSLLLLEGPFYVVLSTEGESVFRRAERAKEASLCWMELPGSSSGHCISSLPLPPSPPLPLSLPAASSFDSRAGGGGTTLSYWHSYWCERNRVHVATNWDMVVMVLHTVGNGSGLLKRSTLCSRCAVCARRTSSLPSLCLNSR